MLEKNEISNPGACISFVYVPC